MYGKTYRTSGRATSGFLSIYDLVNHQSDKATIRVEFENQGHNYIVTREITSSDSDGELLEDGESKAIGKHVYSYVKSRAIGLDWEGFRKSTVVLQGEMSALTDLDPAARKKAFTQLFGLDRYLGYEHLAKKKAEERDSDIHAVDEANKILAGDIKSKPKVKAELGVSRRRASQLRKRASRLENATESRKKTLGALEQSHDNYVAQQAKMAGVDSRLAAAATSEKKTSGEVNRLLTIERRFPIIEKSYELFTGLETNLTGLGPSKQEYDSLSHSIDTNNSVLHEKEGSLTDNRRQVAATKRAILTVRREVPSASKLSKAKRESTKARESEKSARGHANLLRGEIKQIESLVLELQEKKNQVGGKDRCPVCLQKISDPKHVAEHYETEIQSGNAKMKAKNVELTSTRRRISVLSAREKRLDEFERELERGAAKAGQLTRERTRLGDLSKKGGSIMAEVRKMKKEILMLTSKRDALSFDPVEYHKLESKMNGLRKKRVAEDFTTAKTEIGRLPKAKEEVVEAKRILADLRNEKAGMKAELRQLVKVEGKYVRAKKKLSEAQEELGRCRTDLATESEKESQANTRLSELGEKEQRLARNLKQIERFKEEIMSFEELRDVFKNIPENILRRLRPFIEKEGTDIINDLSGSELTALNLEEESLNIEATTNGEVRPIHFFSGGQKTRINMALRVAISRILSRMPHTEEHTFAIMQTLFIDEGDFGNLDEAGIRDAVNVIRNLTKEFDRVILISHVDTIREIFHGYTVEVRKIGLEESAIRAPEIQMNT